MIEQIIITLSALGFFVFTAINRMLIGVIIALIGVPFFLYSTTPDQWGIRVAVSVNAIIYLVAIGLRLRAWRMKRKLAELDDDVDEHLSDAM